MATQNSVLGNPKKSASKTIWLILAIAVLVGSSALIGSYFIKSTSFFSLPHYVCDRALDTTSCLAHVSEVVQGPILTATKDNKFNVLQSFLMKFTSHIQSAMDTANATRLKINNPREGAALEDCVELMDLSIDRVLDSMVAIRKQSSDSLEDAHTWLSSVLTNHATCFDGLEGPARALMEAKLQDLISRTRTCLAILVTVLPPPIIDVTLLSGDFPSWVTSVDRKLLESSAGDIKPNVVVAADGSGDFTTVAEAVASAPDVKDDKSKTRYVIHVKKGIYKENVEIGKKKKNVMLIGDGMDITTITGDLNFIDGTGTFRTATVAAVGDGFMAQDIGFKNSAGPQKHQAVALRVGADKSVINRCRIEAFQDTLYPHSNRQFYSDSYITGTIDFIFGDAAAVFQRCKLAARRPMINQKNMVTAQGRTDPNQNTGYSIQRCDVIPSSDLTPVVDSFQTYLGRPWKNFSRTVVMQSFVDRHIDPAGWAEWDDKSKDFLEKLYYGEYMNYGPGAGTSKRVNWPGYHVIKTAEEASKFTVKQFIQGDVWLKDAGVNFIEGL